MRLFWSSRSPYARKVMIVAHEVGAAERIDCVRIRLPLLDAAAELLRFNPLGQIPTLVLADGRALFDSLVICEYLDAQGRGPNLVPVLPAERVDALHRHALGHGMIDLAIKLLAERMRPAARQIDTQIERRRVALVRGLDRLEELGPDLARLAPDLGHVAIAAALSYLDFRLDELTWRHGRSKLCDWFESFNQRPSMVGTAYVDDLAAASPGATACAPRE
ncbi:MAG: glutathione S-transferase N-terminal domain-containing protein [Burkholderiales bacterium]|nr:glutathione S-transferase N-terminal domain-containing protein [Burkholderiales bacterium]